MARQPIAGVAVWAHTGRGPHLSDEQRRVVLEEWRAALPGKVIVAGANGLSMAREAKRGGADALLAFPVPENAVVYHDELSQELPVIAFYLYEAAGGVDYDDTVLALMRDHPDKLLISGEDRFLGYSLMLGARAALIGMGSALTDIQAALLNAQASGDDHAFLRLSTQIDAFGQATFTEPMDGYIRRMLWALAAEGVIPDDACDDPWGPQLPAAQREAVRRAVREARLR